jgi:hypothetical protein
VLKVVKVVVGTAAVMGCIYLLYRVAQQIQFKAALDGANAIYSSADSEAGMSKAKEAYEALLKKVRTTTQLRMVRAGILFCDANILYYDTTNKPTLEKYEKLLELLRNAQKISGDPTGQWEKRLREIEQRHKEALGPSPEEIRYDFIRLSAKPFDAARPELEAIYRWRSIWQEQGTYQDDKERQDALSEVGKFLRDNYCRIFEEHLRAAQKPEASLEQKAEILQDLEQVKRLDEKAAADYSQKYAKELAEARKAKDQVERTKLQTPP